MGNVASAEEKKEQEEQEKLLKVLITSSVNLLTFEIDAACTKADAWANQLPLDSAYNVDTDNTDRTENPLHVIKPIFSDGVSTMYGCNQDALMSLILALVYYLCNNTVIFSVPLQNCFSAMKTHVDDTPDYGLSAFLCKVFTYNKWCLSRNDVYSMKMGPFKNLILEMFEIDIYNIRCPIFITGDKDSGFGLNMHNIFFDKLLGAYSVRTLASTDLICAIDRVFRDKPRRLYCMEALTGRIRPDDICTIGDLIEQIYNNLDLLTEANIKDLFLKYDEKNKFVCPSEIKIKHDVFDLYTINYTFAVTFVFPSLNSNTLHNFCSRMYKIKEFSNEQVGFLTFNIIESLKREV
jgi:hypothetical protein